MLMYLLLQITTGLSDQLKASFFDNLHAYADLVAPTGRWELRFIPQNSPKNFTSAHFCFSLYYS